MSYAARALARREWTNERAPLLLPYAIVTTAAAMPAKNICCQAMPPPHTHTSFTAGQGIYREGLIQYTRFYMYMHAVWGRWRKGIAGGGRRYSAQRSEVRQWRWQVKGGAALRW